jgi:hypothetical protein
MRPSRLIALAILAFLVTVGLPAQGLCQEILVWDMDAFDGGANGKTFWDPEGSGIIGCEYWIEQALFQNALTYDSWAERDLPPSISTYDLIFIVLGWC